MRARHRAPSWPATCRWMAPAGDAGPEGPPKLRAAGDSRGLARAELILSERPLVRVPLRGLRRRCSTRGAALRRVRILARAAARDPGRGPVLRPCTGRLRRFGMCAELSGTEPGSRGTATVTAVLGGLASARGQTIEDGQLLLAHARSLYEEIGNELGASDHLVVAVRRGRSRSQGIRGGAKAEARASVEGLQVDRHGVPHATTRAVQLADLLLDRRRDEDAAEVCGGLAENEALPSDVLVQFWWRSARARILGRAGQFGRRPRRWLGMP